MHGACGAWGLIAAGLFATQDGVLQAYGVDGGWGLFFGGGIKQLGIQLLGAPGGLGWDLGGGGDRCVGA